MDKNRKKLELAAELVTPLVIPPSTLSHKIPFKLAALL